MMSDESTGRNVTDVQLQLATQNITGQVEKLALQLDGAVVKLEAKIDQSVAPLEYRQRTLDTNQEALSKRFEIFEQETERRLDKIEHDWEMRAREIERQVARDLEKRDDRAQSTRRWMIGLAASGVIATIGFIITVAVAIWG